MTFRLTNSDHIDMTALRVVLKGRGDFGDSCRGRFLTGRRLCHTPHGQDS